MQIQATQYTNVERWNHITNKLYLEPHYIANKPHNITILQNHNIFKMKCGILSYKPPCKPNYTIELHYIANKPHSEFEFFTKSHLRKEKPTTTTFTLQIRVWRGVLAHCYLNRNCLALYLLLL